MADDEINRQEDDGDCPICFEAITAGHAVMCVNQHKICGGCLVGLLQAQQHITCPVCRGSSNFPIQDIQNDQRMLYYTQQKRNRYLQIGSRKLQVEIQGRRFTEQKIKELLGCAANLICHMIKQQSEDEGEQILTFSNRDINVELCLIRDILTINF